MPDACCATLSAALLARRALGGVPAALLPSSRCLPSTPTTTPPLTGRDGSPAACLLYYAKKDVPRLLRLLSMGKKGKGKGSFQRDLDLLKQARQGQGSAR